jgi:WS/DGAT/MGAT family acyltransferase
VGCALEDPNVEKLSLFDQLFYKLDEAGVAPLVMQGASVLDPSAAEHPLDADALAEHIGARLQGIPLLQKKVIRDPLGLGNLWLVEDPDFDLAHHVTRATLPGSGDDDTFLAYLEAFSVERLDMEKPLWRFEIVDGLKGGKLAVASKLHHAVVDGVGAMQTLGSLYDTEPRPPERLRKIRRPPVLEISPLRLTARALSDSLSRAVAGPGFLRRNAGTLLRSLGDALRERVQLDRDHVEKLDVSKTSLNVKASRERRVVAYRVFELDELKSLCRAIECKINDLALLLCSVALERYFAGIGETLESDLVATMPINLRESKNGTTGNAVGASMISLRTAVPGLIDRLRAIQRDSQAAKERMRPKSGSPIDLNEVQALFSPLIIDLVAAVAARVSGWNLATDRALIANTVISNVPGPREEMYVAGARIEHSIPMIPMADTMTLSWGITSFGRYLTIGFHGCGEAVVDKELLIRGIDEAYAELRAFTSHA